MTAALQVFFRRDFQPPSALEGPPFYPPTCPAEALPNYRARWFGARRYVQAVAAGECPVTVSSEDPMFIWMLSEHTRLLGVAFSIVRVRADRPPVVYSADELMICTRHHISPWGMFPQECEAQGIEFPPPFFYDDGSDLSVSVDEPGAYVIPALPIDPDQERIVDDYCNRVSEDRSKRAI